MSNTFKFKERSLLKITIVLTRYLGLVLFFHCLENWSNAENFHMKL